MLKGGLTAMSEAVQQQDVVIRMFVHATGSPYRNDTGCRWQWYA